MVNKEPFTCLTLLADVDGSLELCGVDVSLTLIVSAVLVGFTAL